MILQAVRKARYRMLYTGNNDVIAHHQPRTAEHGPWRPRTASLSCRLQGLLPKHLSTFPMINILREKLPTLYILHPHPQTKSVQLRRPNKNKKQYISLIIVLLTSIVCGGSGGGGRRFTILVGGAARTSWSAFLCRLLTRTNISENSLARFGNSRIKGRGNNNRMFVSALPIAQHHTLNGSFDDSPKTSEEKLVTPMYTESNKHINTCGDDEGRICGVETNVLSSKNTHPKDSSLRIYLIETTSSTMDEAKRIVAGIKQGDEDDDHESSMLKTFVISADSQSHGRGTTRRNWNSSKKGNALFTIGIPISSWTDGLKEKNDGDVVPLTLLPLKVGSLVAYHVQKILNKCHLQMTMPRVTVKWPNDVLLQTTSAEGSDTYKKIAGILIESSHDWFLIGIGINVGYAPIIPSEGVDYGRQATSVSQFCRAAITTEKDNANIENSNDENTYVEKFWIQLSRKLASDIAYDLHSWLNSHPSSSQYNTYISHSGESILKEWKSYIDWDMQLILRDTPQREHVILKSIQADGRVIVEETKTGVTRTLVSDYFL